METTLLSILLVGVLLGMKHATEVDHLAAMATLASGRQSLGQMMRLGVAWGVGHMLTLIAVPLRLSAKRLTGLHQGISAVFGAFSFFLGATMVYQIGFVDGLLR